MVKHIWSLCFVGWVGGLVALITEYKITDWEAWFIFWPAIIFFEYLRPKATKIIIS